MRALEAKTRRFLLLTCVMLWSLAPAAVGKAPHAHAGLPARQPRPGLIWVSADSLGAGSTDGLELEAPELIAWALRIEAGGQLEHTLGDARRTEPPAAEAPASLLQQGARLQAAEPVAEPPAALLGLALGAVLASRRLRERRENSRGYRPQRGARFSRKASTPSMASASQRLSAITAPASR